MSLQSRRLPFSAQLDAYVERVSLRETPEQRALRDETQRLPNANMQTGWDQAQLLQLVVRLCGARRCLEVGVFTGYSTLAVALALPEDGRIVACDVSEEYTSIACRYWQRAGVAAKIDLRLAPAVQTLDALIAAGEAGRFDFAYIDADKTSYPTYYERALVLVRSGGAIAMDNMLWSGRVADPRVTDPDTVALRELNERIAHDERVDLALLELGDGLTLVRKR